MRRAAFRAAALVKWRDAQAAAAAKPTAVPTAPPKAKVDLLRAVVAYRAPITPSVAPAATGPHAARFNGGEKTGTLVSWHVDAKPVQPALANSFK